MFKNHFLTAIRHIKGDKGYSIINIVGLSIGLTCFIIFFFSWKYENSFEKFFADSDKIYHVNATVNIDGKSRDWDRFSPELGKAVKESIPEIKAATCLFYKYEENTVIIGNHAYKEKMSFTDASFFDLFSIPFIKAQKERCLDTPNAVVLSESMAVKLFGNDDPLGKTLKVSGVKNDPIEYSVMGIIKDTPSTTQLHTNIICSRAGLENSYFNLFVMVRGKNYLPKIQSGILNVIQSGFVKENNKYTNPTKIDLQPISEMHFDDERINKYLSILGVAALIVLLLSIINYVNLSIGLSVKRIKEVAIRKTLGSTRSDLIMLHLFKSAFTNLFAVVLAVILTNIIITQLPYTHLLREFSFHEIMDLSLVAGLIGIFIIVTLLSGIYPALYISRLNSASLFSKTGAGLQRRGMLKKGIIFIQFAVLSIFMILSLGISKQLSYIENSDLGYIKNNVFLIEITDLSILMNSDSSVLRNELLKNPHIKEVSAQNGYPSGFTVHDDILIPGKSEPVPWTVLIAGPGFLKTFSIPLLEGRDITEKDGNGPKLSGVLINESAAKMLGEGSAIGKCFIRLAIGGKYKFPMQVVGVFKDFHERTLHYNVEPMIVSSIKGLSTNIAVKIDAYDLQSTIDYIKSTWDKLYPLVPVKYSFLEDEIQKLYNSEYRLGSLSKIFTVLSMIISVMGLFALTALNTEQRKKEIGIRKVLGASISELTSTFLKDIRLAAIAANIVALPVGVILINKWFESFAFKTTIPVIYYLVIICVSFAIAIASIGAQVRRAASANPVESLRSE